jgi:hypothetical protein
MHQCVSTHLVASYKEFKNNATECNGNALGARADAFVHCTGAQPAMLRDVLFARADARRARPGGRRRKSIAPRI